MTRPPGGDAGRGPRYGLTARRLPSCGHSPARGRNGHPATSGEEWCTGQVSVPKRSDAQKLDRNVPLPLRDGRRHLRCGRGQERDLVSLVRAGCQVDPPGSLRSRLTPPQLPPAAQAQDGRPRPGRRRQPSRQEAAFRVRLVLNHLRAGVPGHGLVVLHCFRVSCPFSCHVLAACGCGVVVLNFGFGCGLRPERWFRAGFGGRFRVSERGRLRAGAGACADVGV